MRWILWLGVLLSPVLAGDLLREDDPRTSSSAHHVGRNLYDFALPKDSTFWKCDSDGNEWRKDSYGTIWKKEAGLDPFKKESWDIDGFDRRQATRVGMDSVVQFQLNLDGTVKPESVRRTTWIANVDASPTTLPAYMRSAAFQGRPISTPANLQKERPKLIPDQKPKGP
ncbi:MAG: hypothetical protein NTZ01_00190 [Verrucomicrobia bacterium]|nr:hypothetical protein [Verrucomicrobiota bacterium]